MDSGEKFKINGDCWAKGNLSIRSDHLPFEIIGCS